MKLFNCFTAPGYHTSIISTFSLDFDAYESIALPRLRDAGCNNNILIADDRMLGYALQEVVRLPKSAGRRYSVVGVATRAGGVFHPKVIMQLGKKKGRLLVGSANMTSAGLAGNLEVVGELSTDEEDRQAVPLFRAALAYLKQFLEEAPVSRHQVDWAMKRTRWLYDPVRDKSVADEAVVDLMGGGRVAFLARNHPKGIGERFVDLVGDRAVRRLIAVSPYWDFQLNALRALIHGVGAPRTSILLQCDSALFPASSLRDSDAIQVFDVNKVRGTIVSRFAHAKVLIAESEGADCILFGSANCTEAALGAAGIPGVNEEACLYREMPSGQAAAMLGLEDALLPTMELKVSNFPDYDQADDIPLAELEGTLPGRFELSGDLLRWWPTSTLSPAFATVELLDQGGDALEASLARIGTPSKPVVYRISARVSPYFARVRALGFESSLAVVVVEQAIHEGQRRAMSKGVENALGLLDDADAFEGLWLLEVIQILEDAERDSRTPPDSGDATPATPGHAGQDVSRVLSYEAFVAGRKAEDAPASSRSHLATTHHESVRTFLNALIGDFSGLVLSEDDGDDEQLPSLSLGDETPDGECALDRDDRFDTAAQGGQRNDVGDDEKKRQLLRRRQEYVKDTQRSIADAVERLLSNLRQQAESRRLGAIDLLRFRSLLMVVLGAGSKVSDLLPKDLAAPVRRRQVLPSEGDESWRRLVGRLLFDFFRSSSGTRQPLVASLSLEADGEFGLPEDVLECWATCYWAACACRVAVSDKGEVTAPSVSEERIGQDLYKYTRLLPEQALGPALNVIFDGLSSRYAEGLGVSVDRLTREHRQLVAAAKARSEVAV